MSGRQPPAWSYIPKTTWDRSLPLRGREAEAIHEELRQAREQAADLAVAGGWEIELLERVYVLVAQRQIEELALFRTTRCTTRRWMAGRPGQENELSPLS